MKDMDLSSTCERAEDLVSVLYGEAGEPERRDFEVHLQQCRDCRAEFAAFAQVRESIGEWRNEALSGFVSAHAATPVRSSAQEVAPVGKSAHEAVVPARKSALAALRHFFDLSPLWLKGAVGFAAAVFCVLAALAVWQSRTTDEPAPVAQGNPDAVYTKQDLDRAVQEALAKQEALVKQEASANQQAVAEQQREQQPVVGPKPEKISQTPRGSNIARSDPKARRPFSKAERAQLAADLRLISSDDETDLDLLDDRINRQR